MAQSRMYDETKTWNPFKGCGFDCTYCVPTFKRQAKRQKHNCQLCYEYKPHEHPERLVKIPSSDTIFVCGNSDISFCDPHYAVQIIETIKLHNQRCPYKTYYLQSKRPEYLHQFLGMLPENVILVTTLETNRDEGYYRVSKAPVPSERYRQFLALNYPRKVVTIEPMLDFDVDEFADWIITLNPEYVWLGYNSHPRALDLPEPEPNKVLSFADRLQRAGVKIRGKELRDTNLG